MSTDPVVRCSCSLFIADQLIDDSLASDGEAIVLTDSADGGSIGPRSPATPERSIIATKRGRQSIRVEQDKRNGHSRWRGRAFDAYEKNI